MPPLHHYNNAGFKNVFIQNITVLSTKHHPVYNCLQNFLLEGIINQ